MDLDAVVQAVAAGWRAGPVKGLQYDGTSFEEARSVDRPARAQVRGQLRSRLASQVHRAWLRWLHPTSGLPHN